MKVPTGGGKTFLACATLNHIVDCLSPKYRFVIWLVPSDAILTQTLANLSDTAHPYRQRIDNNFNHNVAIYTKEMLLQAQNFSPATVNDNLSICILSYASLRIDSNKKDIRNVYKENGALENLSQYLNAEDFTLIDIIRKMNPLVIVDESHNATSKLSVEMLTNLNPSFILELTATPKIFSNVLVEIKPAALKAEHMVKLPVIVYNPHDKKNLIDSVIGLRNNLELATIAEEKISGRYIRPIVLF